MKCVETKRVLKNADLRHSSFTVVMQKRKKRKFASPVLNVLISTCTTGIPQLQSATGPFYGFDVSDSGLVACQDVQPGI
jgi:hypothetical protein